MTVIVTKRSKRHKKFRDKYRKSVHKVVCSSSLSICHISAKFVYTWTFYTRFNFSVQLIWTGPKNSKASRNFWGKIGKMLHAADFHLFAEFRGITTFRDIQVHVFKTPSPRWFWLKPIRPNLQRTIERSRTNSSSRSRLFVKNDNVCNVSIKHF